jgi:hypothetical protein
MMLLSKYLVLAMLQFYSFDFSGMSALDAGKIKDDWVIRYSIEAHMGDLNFKSFDPFPYQAGFSLQLFNNKWKAGSRVSIKYADPFYGNGLFSFDQAYLFYSYSLAGMGELRAGILPNPVYRGLLSPFVFQVKGLDFRGVSYIKKTFTNTDVYYDGFTDFVPSSGIGAAFVHRFTFPLVLDAGFLFSDSAYYLRSDYLFKMDKLLFRPEILFLVFDPGLIEFSRNKLYTEVGGTETISLQTGKMSISRIKLLILAGELGFELVYGVFDLNKGDLSAYEGFNGWWGSFSIFYLIDFKRSSSFQYILVRNDLSLRDNGVEQESSIMDAVSIRAGLLKGLEIDIAFSIRVPRYQAYQTKSYLYIGARYSHNISF